ncbi:unnamed protein product [Pneumocystis jirovecii]|uniref:Hsp90 chaperone protein kinase-targeting subunit n=2 Tax=Pneumocystis jirovecii TaxID=42068 RepID=L0PGI1_PNEJI|nr:uncharacterized protein T551_01469 [Pneumocystis jirovecii RU7]KTW30917.1 hypothetical protein T551_01469 [Pneumocystis jirovecii RU7]CCJ31184.1 unnamed protein product [Pneumocystis jirovecii]
MVLDYSKWDKLELSDDSDIEVHPNVDKRSFIRWKQRDIHEKRQARKRAIQDITATRKMNTGLVEQISRIIESLKTTTNQSPDNVIDDVLNKIKLENIPNIEGAVKYHVSIGTLIEQIKQSLNTLEGEERRTRFIQEFEKNTEKLQNLIIKATEDLEKLEEEGKEKITSEDIRIGFESSSITKTPAKKEKKKIQTVEVLNKQALEEKNLEKTSLSENITNTEDETTEHIEPSSAARDFSKLDSRDYHTLLKFISLHPEIVSDEQETDGLLIDAFNYQMQGNETLAKQCVHQGLLLQYCRQLGKDGVTLFFQRVTSANHAAHKLFNDDVHQTYSRIKVRAAEILLERDTSSPVEQIQLHAVDPNTKITISIPPPSSDDPDTQMARQIFDSFSPDLQAALYSGQLDNINKVLASVPLQQAENIVNDLKLAGLLSIEDELIDATHGSPPHFSFPPQPSDSQPGLLSPDSPSKNSPNSSL